MERQPEYPPEYDLAACCQICGVDTDDCKCAECDTCGQQGEPKCIADHNLDPDCMVRSIWDLARHVGAFDDLEALSTERRVGKEIYKNGKGISFRALYPHPGEKDAVKPPHGADAVALSAYLEGTTISCSETVIPFPFTPYAFDECVRACEFETESGWQQTHGCDACPESETYPGYKRIDPNCSACKGEGVIL